MEGSAADPPTGRLAALRRYDILDTPAEEAYDRITRLAARWLDVPIALVTFVDEDRQWFKSCFGIDIHETSRKVSFCAHNITDGAALVVEDATDDTRFVDNPLVTGPPGIRFYAGAPLVVSGGHVLGSLCVIDTEPRTIQNEELQTLRDLAAMVVDELELRATHREHAAILESITDAFYTLDAEWRFTYVNQQAETLLERPREELLGANIWEEFPETKDLPNYEAYHRAVETGEPVQFEAYSPLFEAWFDVKAYPMDTGGLSVYFSDITAERERQEALKESQMLLERAQRIAHLGYWDWNVETGSITWSDETFHILGYEPGAIETTADTYFEAIPEVGRPRVRSFIQKVLEGDRTDPDERCIEHRIRQPDGTVRTVELEAQAVEAPDAEEPTRILGVVLDITRRRQREQVLHQERDLRASVFETSAAAITVLDRDGRITHANGRAEEVLGLDPNQLLGRSFDAPTWKIQAVDGGAFPKDRLPFARVVATDAPVYDVQHAIAWPDGQRRILSINGAPIKGYEGATIGVVFAITDVTERNKREQALRDQRQRLEMALVGGELGMWDWNMNTDEVTYDERWAEMLGYSLDEVEGTEAFFAEHTHPEDLERVRVANERHAAGEIPFIDLEIRMRHQNGSWRWILDRGKIVEHNDDGSPRRMVGTHMDITDRKEAEQELHRQRERLQMAVIGGSIGMWDWDMETDATVYDERWAAILGYTLDEVEYHNTFFERHTHPDDLRRVYDDIERHAAGEIPFIDLEIRMRHKDGTWRWVLDRGMIVERTDDGTPRRMVGTHMDITDHQQVEEEVRRQRNLLQNIFDTSPAAIVTADEEGRFVSASRRAKELLGITSVEEYAYDDAEWNITGENGDPIPTEELPFARVMATRKPVYGMEHAIDRPDGKRRLVSVSGAPLNNATGELEGAVFVLQDVTERRLAESKLQLQLETLHQVVKGTPRDQTLHYLITAIEAQRPGMRGSVLFYDSENNSVCHGVAPSLPLEYSKAIDGAKIGPNAGSCGTAMYEGKPVIVEDIASDPHWKEYRDLALAHGLRACWAVPILDAHGDVLGSFAFYYDEPTAPSSADRVLIEQARSLAGVVIERHRAAEALRDREERVQMLYDAMGILAQVETEHELAEIVLDLVTGTLGYSICAVRYAKGGALVPEVVSSKCRAVMGKRTNYEIDGSSAPAKAFRTGNTIYYHEATQREVIDGAVQSAAYVPLGTYGTVSIGTVQAGGINAFDVYLLDILAHNASSVLGRIERERELIRAKETAEEMNQLKSAFLANMSHEIRTPLTSILGFTEVLESMDLESSAARFVRLIHRGGDRLLTTLNSVLDLSQLEAGAMTLHPEPVRVASLLRDLVSGFERRAAENEVELQLTVPDTPLLARLDEAAFQRIVSNLVSNAIKFTGGEPSGGIVAIDLSIRSDRIAVEVADTGVGIEEAFIPHLFDAFKQESTGNARQFEGTGLGLAITKKLVDLMGGTIDVASVKGQGATFLVSLPYESA